MLKIEKTPPTHLVESQPVSPQEAKEKLSALVDQAVSRPT